MGGDRKPPLGNKGNPPLGWGGVIQGKMWENSVFGKEKTVCANWGSDGWNIGFKVVEVSRGQTVRNFKQLGLYPRTTWSY